jgi:hypothetical protein
MKVNRIPVFGCFVILFLYAERASSQSPGSRTQPASLSTRGQFTGTVADDIGVPVAGATVSYSRRIRYASDSRHRLAPVPGELSFAGSVTTDEQGRFAAPPAPPGAYVLCLDHPAGGYVDPCKWGGPVTVAGLAAEEARSVGSIPVRRGAILNIRLFDAKSLLPPCSDITTHCGVTVAIQSGGAFLNVPVSSTDPGVRQFTVTVPMGLQAGLWLFSRELIILDESGNPLPP